MDWMDGTSNGFAWAHSLDKEVQMSLLLCPVSMGLSVKAPQFYSMWQNSNRLDQVSLHDSLRVAFHRSKSSNFRISEGPWSRKLKTFISQYSVGQHRSQDQHNFKVQRNRLHL